MTILMLGAISAKDHMAPADTSRFRRCRKCRQQRLRSCFPDAISGYCEYCNVEDAKNRRRNRGRRSWGPARRSPPPLPMQEDDTPMPSVAGDEGSTPSVTAKAVEAPPSSPWVPSGSPASAVAAPGATVVSDEEDDGDGDGSAPSSDAGGRSRAPPPPKQWRPSINVPYSGSQKVLP